VRLLFFLFSLSLLHRAGADTISWNGQRGTLQKAGFGNQRATHSISSGGGIQATFTLGHRSTTAQKFTYSKWEIDRWGDPGSLSPAPGSWQAVSNSANQVGLTLWGYWGNAGSPLVPGDTTSYQLTIDFDQPVTSLTLPLRGINALADSRGNNAIDIITVESFFDGTPQPSPTYSSVGTGVVRTGDTLTGDFAHPIGTDTGQVRTSDQGTATATFPGSIDRVVLTITSEARHPTPALLQDQAQNWSISLGDLTFDAAPVAARSLVTWQNRRSTLSKPAFDSSPASTQVVSHDEKSLVTFDMTHVATTAGRFSYSKWEIDRWGDPTAAATPLPGSWQVQSNVANDVVLGLWGYWGNDGTPGSPPLAPGDLTSYKLRIKFDQPVTDLKFSLHGVDSIVGNGQNSFDRITVDSFLRDIPQAVPVFSNRGSALAQSSNILNADLNLPNGTFLNTGDAGSVSLRFISAVDEVVLTLVNEAKNPMPAAFQPADQKWSFSIGELSFLCGTTNNIGWAARQGTLSKPEFTNASATYQAVSADGGVIGSFQLDHIATTGNKPSYSKWEIDRWGDPSGVHTQLGSWQMMSNAANDIVLGIWGYWGTDGTANGPRVAVGDQTSYRITIRFNRPLENLSFFLHGINALLKPEAGFNSQDIVTVSSYLGTSQLPSPVYSQEGNAFTRTGDTLSGNFAVQINNGFSGQHISDQGSIKVQLVQPADRVELILVNRADHPVPASYQDGLQTYSFSIGRFDFRYGNVGSSAALFPGSTSPPPGPHFPAPPLPGARVSLAPTPQGTMRLRVLEPVAGLPDLARLEFSPNLSGWLPYPVTQTQVQSVDRGVEIDVPTGSPPGRGFFRWRK
jgi:hypothetical protein